MTSSAELWQQTWLPKVFSTFQPWSNFVPRIGTTLKCSCRAARSASLAPETPLFLIGLFHWASQQPWQLQRWLSLACFHYKPWHLISLRKMGSERWGTRVAKPFSSIFDDTLSASCWCEKCLHVPASQSSCFCPFCLLLKTQCSEFLGDLFLTPEIRILHSCLLWGGQFSCRLIKRWHWKWDFGETSSKSDSSKHTNSGLQAL